MTHPRTAVGRRCLTALILASSVGLFAACSSNVEPPSGNPTTASEGAHSTGSHSSEADCSSQAILTALPGGATMQRFDCAKVGDTEWAAARVDPGNTVFFLQWNGTTWNAEDADSICGTASAGLPASLLSYCP